MYPLVLIKSLGQKTSSDVIQEIFNANGDNDEIVTLSFDDQFLEAHKLNIFTKYYKTQVYLIECEDLSKISNTVKDEIECTIFYFDSDDKRFLDKLKTLVEFTKSNNVELSALITQDLNKENGLSYEDIMKTSALTMNVIDLNESYDTNGTPGYEEVLELLRNHVWSTVDISKNISMFKPENDDINAEEALNEFEELLSKFQHFKNISPTLCREDVLKNAEDLADLFAKILNED